MLLQPKNRIKHETVLFQPKNRINMKMCYFNLKIVLNMKLCYFNLKIVLNMKLCYCNLKMYHKLITANMVSYEFLYTVKSGRINLVIVPIYYECYKVLKEYIFH